MLLTAAIPPVMQHLQHRGPILVLSQECKAVEVLTEHLLPPLKRNTLQPGSAQLPHISISCEQGTCSADLQGLSGDLVDIVHQHQLELVPHTVTIGYQHMSMEQVLKVRQHVSKQQAPHGAVLCTASGCWDGLADQSRCGLLALTSCLEHELACTTSPAGSAHRWRQCKTGRLSCLQPAAARVLQRALPEAGQLLSLSQCALQGVCQGCLSCRACSSACHSSYMCPAEEGARGD